MDTFIHHSYITQYNTTIGDERHARGAVTLRNFRFAPRVVWWPPAPFKQRSPPSTSNSQMDRISPVRGRCDRPGAAVRDPADRIATEAEHPGLPRERSGVTNGSRAGERDCRPGHTSVVAAITPRKLVCSG